ncbi:MAG: hypothetical protein ACXW20_02825 [Burkholderiales bacterium]
MAHDRGAELCRPIAATRAHGGDAVRKFDFSDRFHAVGAVRAVHVRLGLHEDRCDDSVPAAGVREQLVDQVAPTLVVQRVHMRVDDRQIGLERRLAPEGGPGVQRIEFASDCIATSLRHQRIVTASRVAP